MAQSPEVAEKLRQMEEKFKSRLTATREEISNLHSDKDLQVLIEICHKLAGTAGTFGYAALSADMKIFEQELLSLNAHPLSQQDIKACCSKACTILDKTIKA